MPASEQWHDHAAAPAPKAPSRDALASGDYELLRERGWVAALYFTPPAYFDPRYPEHPPSNPMEMERWRREFPAHGSRAYRRRAKLNQAQRENGHSQGTKWQQEQLEPWWAQLVARARAEGVFVHCTKGTDFDTPYFTSVYGSAVVLDAETRVAPHELAPEGDAWQVQERLRAQRDEAIARS